MSNWINKIQDFEVKPPEFLWQKLDQELDSQKEFLPLKTISTKLYNYQPTVPNSFWNKIENVLNKSNKKNSGILKYIIGAASAACVALVFFNLTQKEIPADELIAGENKIEKTIAPNNNLDAPANTQAKSNEVISNTNFTVTDKNTSEKIKTIEGNLKTNEINSIVKISKEIQEATKVNSNEIPSLDALLNTKIKNENGAIIVNANEAEIITNYTNVVGPNGMARVNNSVSKYVNLSQQQFDPATDEILDEIIQQSKAWKSKLNNWSAKMSKSITPSPSNMLGIIELSNLVEDNN